MYEGMLQRHQFYLYTSIRVQSEKLRKAHFWSKSHFLTLYIPYKKMRLMKSELVEVLQDKLFTKFEYDFLWGNALLYLCFAEFLNVTRYLVSISITKITIVWIFIFFFTVQERSHIHVRRMDVLEHFPLHTVSKHTSPSTKNPKGIR